MSAEQSLAERLRAERDERRRIAELVHDGPVQHISALTQMLDAARHAVESSDLEQARALTERSLEVAREAAAELRELVQGLEPATLADEGFPGAIRELAARAAARRGVVLELDVAAASDLGQGASSGLYQVVREAVDQAIRRGPPTTLRITATGTASGGIEVVIADDGAPERRQAVLDGLDERTRELNGSFSTERADGWTVTRVTLPPSATSL